MSLFPRGTVTARNISYGLALAFLVMGTGCTHKQADDHIFDQRAIWLEQVPELKTLNVSNAEIGELSKAHDVGLSDKSCVALIKLARSRNTPFTDGQAVADLLSTGSSEQTVLELAHMNQLGAWAGQAQVLRLAGFSDKVVLAVAQRRSEGLSVLSGEKLGEVKNSGASEDSILEMIQRGDTDSQATTYIAQRERAAGGHGFVYQNHKKP